MEFTTLVKERYSVRQFSTRPVEPDMITALLEAARVAPTAVNKQPYRILVLRDQAGMEKLKSCTPYTFNAPMALIVCGKKSEAWVRAYDNANSMLVDASIVGTHIMLAAHDMGLGTTWVGHFDPVAVRMAYKLPDGMEPVVIFPVGYPAPDAKPALPHAKRRPLSETVIYDGF